MAEKEEEKKAEAGLAAGLSSGLIWAVLFGIAGVILGIYPIISFGALGISGMLMSTLALAGLGFCLGFIYGIFPSSAKGVAVLLILIILGLMGWWLFSMGALGKGPFGQLGMLLDFGKAREWWQRSVVPYKYCLAADVRCPWYVSWEQPIIQNKSEELSVEVNFDEKKIKPDSTISLLIKLTVRNPELAELRIRPRCWFKSKEAEKGRELEVRELGAYGYGNELRFPKAETLHSSFRCVGEIPEAAEKTVYSEKVIVELERPVRVETIWPVWIGAEPRKGLVQSEMRYNAPYTISLASSSDMPFEQGRSYGFQLILRRRAADVQFKQLESIVISYPEEIMLSCESFAGTDHELELREIGYNALKNLTQYSAEEDKFIFPCSLYVAEARREAELALVQLQAYYSVYSDHETKIIKA